MAYLADVLCQFARVALGELNGNGFCIEYEIESGFDFFCGEPVEPGDES